MAKLAVENKAKYTRNTNSKKTSSIKEERLEDILLSCRNHLRGRAPMTDKRDLLLTLVFLKFIGDRFNARKAEILEENKDDSGLAEIAVKTASFYKQAGIFFLPDECLWSELVKTESRNMAVAFDTAIAKLEQNEEKLRNALPQQIFTKTALEPGVIKSVVDDINRIDPAKFTEKELIGRVYEYFLQAFSINADKEEGEFYVLHVQLKHKEYDSRNIALLTKLIPQKLVFAMLYGQEAQLAIFHTKLISSGWQAMQDVSIPISGLNLDSVWDNIVKSIGQIEVEQGNSLVEQIAANDKRDKILSQIATLQKKMANEKQPRRKRDLFQQISTLKSQIP